MRDFGATVLCCTPSYALHLHDAGLEIGINIKDLPLRLGVFGAEPWTEEMRREIEDKLGITATNIYGLSEIMGPGVSQSCAKEQHGMHIWEDHFLPEIIDPVSGEILPEGSTGELRDGAGLDLLFVGQEAGLDDDLDLGTALDGVDNALDVALDKQPVAGLDGADIDDHVDLTSALGGGIGGLEGLRLGGAGAERESDDAARRHAAALELLGDILNVGGVHAHAGAVILLGLVADLADLVDAGFRLQVGMVNVLGHVCRGIAVAGGGRLGLRAVLGADFLRYLSDNFIDIH